MTVMTAERPTLRPAGGGAEHPIRKAVRLGAVATWFYQHLPAAEAGGPAPGESGPAARVRWACELAAAERWLDATTGARVGWTRTTGGSWTAMLWVTSFRSQEPCPVAFRRQLTCDPLSDQARIIEALLARTVRLWEP